MSKIKDILLGIWGALCVLFYVLLKVKDKQIERQDQTIDQLNDEVRNKEAALQASKQLGKVNHEKSKRESFVDGLDDDGVNELLNEKGWIAKRDRSESDPM